MDKSIHTEVVLVDALDNPIGTMEKLEAHRKGLLHRAFSVFVFNSKEELLIQQRAFGKYHSEGLWTNTCCSHPGPGETVVDAAHRRLQEEMGFDCPMEKTFYFIYEATLDNDLTEHELDHIVIGFSNEIPVLNKEEAIDYKWMNLEEIKADIALYPENYTAWFKIIFNEHFEQLKLHLKHESLQKRDI